MVTNTEINFNTKHLTKGDPVPPFNGKLRVYNMRFCPYAQRTMLALIAKGIDYDLVNIDLTAKPEWYASKSAFTKVPALEIAEGVSIYESLVTVEYLDEVYPQRPLLPKDPILRAKDKIIVEAAGPISTAFMKLIWAPDTVTNEVINAFFKALDFVQNELKVRGTKFLDGNQPGFADYMIWPWFEKILTIDDERLKMDEKEYKLLLAYLKSMLQDPVVSEYLIPKEITQAMYSAYKSGGKPKYDELLAPLKTHWLNLKIDKQIQLLTCTRVYKYLVNKSYLLDIWSDIAMLSTAVSLVSHLYTSFQGVQAVRRVLGYINYSNMAARSKINFNTKHLKTGDPLPPFTGKLRVYNMRFCPFAQRTILALNAKEIDYEVVNIDLVDKPEWLASKSAFTKVPALEIAEGVSIYESLVTVEYLDEVYPQRPLLPKDPVLKAKDKIIVEASVPLFSTFIKLVKAPEAVTDEVINSFFKASDFIQNELKGRGTKFLDGNQPGFADYMIWPWFERLITIDDERIKMDEQKYKLLLAYVKDMLQDPIVSEYLIPKEVFQTFHNAYKVGEKPNYDLLFEA
ncbi:uncharacterized protein LOC113501406 [Trichoplusia ni]|uniref:Uncharacterized protein LOC113501406 n=1 Tax=Trichoplusia ni TaxID=7111 RepID=A0A7E5WC74_TRINI|nr:uncharacterized protein LOC113501406 [Trichoplusia ni]